MHLSQVLVALKLFLLVKVLWVSVFAGSVQDLNCSLTHLNVLVKVKWCLCTLTSSKIGTLWLNKYSMTKRIARLRQMCFCVNICTIFIPSTTNIFNIGLHQSFRLHTGINNEVQPKYKNIFPVIVWCAWLQIFVIYWDSFILHTCFGIDCLYKRSIFSLWSASIIDKRHICEPVIKHVK